MAFELSARDLQWVLEGALAEALLSFSKLVKCFSSQPSPWRWSGVGIVCEQEEPGVVAVPPWEGDMAGGSGLASLLVAKDLSPLLPAGRWDRWRGEKGLIFSPQLILPLSLTR